MKILHHILPVLLAAVAFSSCSGDAPLSPAEGEAKPTPIEIEATVDNGDAANRSDASTTIFARNGGFGLFACKHGTMESFAPNTSNIYVYCDKIIDGKLHWRYSYSGGQYYSDILYLICNDREDFKYNADFYAYYPHRNGVTNLISISYNGYTNIMYAVQNGMSGVNEDYAIDGEKKTVKFHFVKKMAQFLFHFRFYIGAHPDNSDWDLKQTLKSITIRQACLPDETIISQYVYFNAIEDKLTLSKNAADVKKLVYDCNTTIDKYKYDKDGNVTDNYTEIPMCVPPCDLSSLADDDTVYTIDFVLGNVNILTLDVTKAMLRHSDGTTYGMQAGYTYHFYITMENYLHLDKVYVDKDWIHEDDEINIKI